MILTLDIGNSQIHGGVFDSKGETPRVQFRKSSTIRHTSDEIGLFLRSVLRENDVEPSSIRKIALCSVVPDLMHSIQNACRKYFDLNPFVLQAGARTGLKIKYRNPLEVGADRIASAIAATHLFPKKNLIVADFGTATTICALSSEKDYLGGMILPGLRLSMEALESKTAKLPAVEIVAPDELIGRSTVENIQSGLYYGNLCMLRELTRVIRKEHLKDDKAMVIGTGGFSRLFEKEGVFDALVPELVLIGLYRALQMNA